MGDIVLAFVAIALFALALTTILWLLSWLVQPPRAPRVVRAPRPVSQHHFHERTVAFAIARPGGVAALAALGLVRGAVRL